MSLTLTDTEVEHYGGKVWQAFQIADRYGTSGMIYYGPEDAEAINVPTVQKQQARHYADNQDHRGVASELKGVSVPLYEPLKGSTDIKKSDVRTRPSLNLLGNLGKEHGLSVGNAKTIQLTAFLAKVADTAGNIIAVDTSTNSGSAIQSGVKSIASALDMEGVPPQGRMGMLKSDKFYDLTGERGVYGLEYGGQADVQNVNVNRTIPYLDIAIKNLGTPFGSDLTDQSFDYMNLPMAADFDMTNVLGVFWHESTWIMRVQEALNTTAKFLDQYQAWLTLARLHMGYKERDTTGIYVLIEDPSA